MSQVLTVSCKLEVAPYQVEKLDAVLFAFSSCCKYVNEKTPEKLNNQIAVQSLIYKEAREYSGLSAQMTIHAIRRVCANRKTAKQQNRPVKGFAPTSATYDSRTFTFKEKDWTVSLTMLKGREKFPLHIGNYQRHILSGRNHKSAVLAKRKDGIYYLQIQLESEPPEPEKTEKVLGVDLGRTDICVTSDGEKFSGKQITQVRDKYARVRTSLQKKASKGTRSTRRRARQILQVNLVFVDPQYTSQTCNKCLHIHPARGESYRKGKKFRCNHCGWLGDSDENGAKNISALGLLLNQPGGSGLACCLSDHVLGLLKSPSSA